MSEPQNLLHPETRKTLEWISKLIERQWVKFEEESPDSIRAAKALAFVQGITPAFQKEEALDMPKPSKEQIPLFGD